MEESRPMRRLLVSYARPEAISLQTRAILSHLGYAIVPEDQVASLPEPQAGRGPDLRIVDEARLEDVPPDPEGLAVPIILLTGRDGVRSADSRIVAALPRPAGLHELYRLVQQVLEETPRSTPRIRTVLDARCRQEGREWPASLLSISENGCLMHSSEPLLLGSQVELSFDLPDGPSIETCAETAYQLPPNLGLVFHQTPAQARRAIQAFVTAQLDAR
jgi:hypothetical protein